MDWESRFSEFLMKEGLSVNSKCPFTHKSNMYSEDDFHLTLGDIPKEDGFRLLLGSCWHTSCRDSIRKYMGLLNRKWRHFIGGSSLPNPPISEELLRQTRERALAEVKAAEDRQKDVEARAKDLLSKIIKSDIPNPIFSGRAIDFGVFITRFWKPTDIICLGTRYESKGHLYYANLDHIRKMHFSNSPEQTSPMTFREIDGKRRSENIIERRYMVLEMDDSPIQHQWNVLMAINTHITPLLMVVHTGGKSLHGWFHNSALFTENKDFYEHLGYDESSFKRLQLCRTPGVMRTIGLATPTEQRIIFLDKTYRA